MPASSRARAYNVKSVAIIGAGPTGLAAAKYLLAEQHFDRIDIFEQRSRVGGVWDYDPKQKTVPEDTSVPQTNPNPWPSKPFWNSNGHPSWTVPMYDRLETNIPKEIMGFSDLNWNEETQLFPRRATVTEYIERYAAPVKDLIKFQTQVAEVKPLDPQTEDHHGWTVQVKQFQNGKENGVYEENYDAVVAASGHFAVPYAPKIKGVEDFKHHHPRSLLHSMYYKTPEDFRDKKVVCVGNGASGTDIASQIMTACKWPLLQSQRSESWLLPDASPSKVDKGEIVEFIAEDRAVKFADGSIEKDVDHVVFCTGYFYSFPYLDLRPPLIGDGTHVQNLYQHLFYQQNATLALPALQQRIIPFPMAEAQAAVIARVWSGRLTLPSQAEMKAWEEEVESATGGGRAFHILKFPQDADYINTMYDFAISADAGKIKGKTPPRWDARSYWLRENIPLIKKAFQERGEGRHEIRTIEELGFSYEQFLQEKEKENKTRI